MANQYHDELGRFCSKNEMGSAVERLSDLMTSAPTQEARDEAASQWMLLKTDYLALTNLDYDGRLAELDARIFSTHSRTELRKLQAERDQLQLEADASDEGFNNLLRKSLAAPSDSAFRFADDYRIEQAAVYRTRSDTATAIGAYKAGSLPRYESTIDLFNDTNTKVARTKERVYVYEQTPGSYEIEHSVALDAPDFDEQVLSLRQQVGDRLADQAKWGKEKLKRDIYKGCLDAVYFGPAGNAAQIRRYHSGEPDVVAEAEFNENGAFVKATVAHDSGDGSVVTLDTPAQFRAFLSKANKFDSTVKPLPSWKVSEPTRPAFAAPDNNDMEELDLLF